MFNSGTLSVNSINPALSPRRAVEALLTWQERARQRRELAGLDARALADIGLAREQALAEVRKPFWQA
jgi:uncharacterized protein YjiS (DUF1127 family)